MRPAFKAGFFRVTPMVKVGGASLRPQRGQQAVIPSGTDVIIARIWQVSKSISRSRQFWANVRINLDFETGENGNQTIAQ